MATESLIETDIEAYLRQHQDKELLRFLTCGSVDDGKSTLIGRLLHDTQMIYEDQLKSLKRDSERMGTTGEELDLALLVDGLQAEREQGITIDVAYRYFSTDKRKFIIADTPGHEQYTRNMATGASTCELAVILIDARKGVLTQTRRHSFIVSLLGIKHIVVAVNKMDLMDWDQQVFDRIRTDYLTLAERLELSDVRFIPVSALKGDNVVNPSANMPWYTGPTLLEVLETVEIAKDRNLEDFRFPVQYVNRPHLDFRGFSGTLAGGIVRPGDAITVLPSGQTSRVKEIVTYDGNLTEAFPPMAVTLTLEDEIDVSRGDMIVHSDNLPHVADRCRAHIVWMTEKPLVPGRQYVIKQTTRTVTGSVSRILHRTDVNTLEETPAEQLAMNEIGLCELAFNAPLAFDPYERCKGTGAFILIDRLTNVTVGAGMITGLSEDETLQRPVTPEERAIRFGQQPAVVALTGGHARELAYQLERRLFDTGHAATVLDAEQLPEISTTIATALTHAGLIVLWPQPQTVPEGALTLDTDRLDLNQALKAIKEAGIVA
ncbi:bifunctional enzyme CysN/CysC [Methylomarinovum tepidoasis]|uniref:Sulfate adenylyltransferase subunit 1 n=1 Tax=Methylomarinovum tepidoasis TaxID=2840183 RepID=A0AAU9CHQ6_9GAMM|nr:sulfate adenylyltransferase subunit CysN [Methylomarinovum sp. IN45]BCX89828.1 bifunctional enzyme CysN/CysC [Methylomarinovum sp. IN45]